MKVGTFNNIRVVLLDRQDLPSWFVPKKINKIKGKRVRVVEPSFDHPNTRVVVYVRSLTSKYKRVGNLDLDGTVANNIRACGVTFSDVELVSFTETSGNLNLRIKCSVNSDHSLPPGIGSNWGMILVTQPVEVSISFNIVLYYL